jgi:hypothetical protein
VGSGGESGHVHPDLSDDHPPVLDECGAGFDAFEATRGAIPCWRRQLRQLDDVVSLIGVELGGRLGTVTPKLGGKCRHAQPLVSTNTSAVTPHGRRLETFPRRGAVSSPAELGARLAPTTRRAPADAATRLPRPVRHALIYDPLLKDT